MNREVVGKEYPPITYEVGREKIREYALAIKEDNPLYLDPEFARRSKYGTVVAPPTFAAVYYGRLLEALYTDSELDLDISRVVHAEQEFTFGEVVRSGDLITTRATIDAVFSKESRSGATRDFMIIRTTSLNQDGKMVCEGKATLVERKNRKNG